MAVAAASSEVVASEVAAGWLAEVAASSVEASSVEVEERLVAMQEGPEAVLKAVQPT